MADTKVDGSQTNVDTPVTPTTENHEGGESKGHPENVPWTQYVGVKEQLGKTKEKVTGLEEQLKNALSVEEASRLREELKTAKEEAQKVKDELNAFKESSVSEKRKNLISRGIPEEKIKDMSEKELDAVAVALGSVPTGQTQTKPDLSSGGGGTPLKGSPHQLAVAAYGNSR